MAEVGLAGLTFEGQTLQVDVAHAITAASVTHTLDGASTLDLTLRDSRLHVLRSTILTERISAQFDGRAFELVGIDKAGFDLQVTFEELGVAALRKRNTPLKVAAGTTTRVEFASRLVREEPWLKFVTTPGPHPKAKVELARGTPAANGQAEQREDSWTALGRLADEVGWRRFALGNEVWFVPDSWLLGNDPHWKWTEGSPGVDRIDFGWDVGLPVAEATVTLRAPRWAVGPGQVVELFDMGPANGRWLVADYTRGIFQVSSSVKLIRERPTLPEPEPSSVPSDTDMADEGDGSASPEGGGSTVSTTTSATTARAGTTSSGGWQWPVQGRVGSGFGPRRAPKTRQGRGSSFHQGLDIAAPTGTPVYAANTGAVVHAGSAGGYGLAVYIRHSGNVFSRYAHLSTVLVRRGMPVRRGELIGRVGSTGKSTGPHLHFEIRPGDRPTDPRKYLP